MNEQQMADLFSDQVDRMLQGESTDIPADAGDLQELLDIVGQPTTQTQFQAGSSAQAAFQSQLASFFGPLANGGSPMTILGLSKVWFISIVTAVVVVASAAAIITVVTTTVIISANSDVPEPPPDQDPSPDQDPPPDQDPIPDEPPSDDPPSDEPPSDDPPSDDPPPDDSPITLVFVNNIQVSTLCQDVYTTQSTVVNSGDLPVSNASLVSEVIEGADFVDNVDISSTGLGDALIFNSIAAKQKVDLDIKVKVKAKFYEQSADTKIKVKLSVKDKGDHDRGHGNDPDGFDEDNPGHKKKKGSSQIITIVNQSAQYVTLSGVAHDNGNGTLLIDGTVVSTNDCTGLPSTIVIGSFVQVIGLLQPDGSFLAVNISIINTTVIGDFDSGVPLPGDDGGSGGSKGGGSKKGGSGGSKKGGSGGSKGGSK